MGALAGCNNQQEPETSQASSAETTATSMVESTQTQASSQSETSQSSTSSSQAASRDSSNTNSTADIYAQIQAAFPDLVLPKDIPLASGKVLNAATAGSQSDASILYYGLDKQLPLNDKALNEETPIAAFQSKDYQSADEAAAAVNVTADDGGQAVDLGYWHYWAYARSCWLQLFELARRKLVIDCSSSQSRGTRSSSGCQRSGSVSGRSYAPSA